MSDFFWEILTRYSNILHLEMLWTPWQVLNRWWGAMCKVQCGGELLMSWDGWWYGSLWLPLNSSWELLVWTHWCSIPSINQSIRSNYSTFSAFDICSSQKRANKLLLTRPNNCEVWSLSWVSITFRRKKHLKLHIIPKMITKLIWAKIEKSGNFWNGALLLWERKI